MGKSGSYYYPVCEAPTSSVGGGNFKLKDGVPVPSGSLGNAIIYIDQADGSLKIKFSNGTVKVLTTDP